MQTVTLPRNTATRAAFTMDGDYMAPWLRRGEIVEVEWALPGIGQCGIFQVGSRYVLRQYCEDGFGNVYLFVLNRTCRDMDLLVPAGEPIRCAGRIRLEKLPPLPLN